MEQKKEDKLNLLRLAEVLAEKGMQGKELAEKLGITLTTVSNITQGNNFPKPETLLKIAEALDVDIRELFIPTKKTEAEAVYMKRNGDFVEVGNISFGKGLEL